jgi:hypothetical protein
MSSEVQLLFRVHYWGITHRVRFEIGKPNMVPKAHCNRSVDR